MRTLGTVTLESSFGISPLGTIVCMSCSKTVPVLWPLWEGRKFDPPLCRDCVERAAPAPDSPGQEYLRNRGISLQTSAKP
jgi:hypothetical protein